MGTGYGTGENRAYEAAEMAINSPLLEDIKIDGATGILVNMTGGSDMTLAEVSDAIGMIEDAAGEDVHLIFGYVTLDEPCEEVKCTVIATGFNSEESFADTSASRQSYVSTRNIYQDSANSPVSGRSSVMPKQRDSVDAMSAAVRNSMSMTPAMAANQENFDIPAFIRRSKE
jgi:cell division protein FtsZ